MHMHARACVGTQTLELQPLNVSEGCPAPPRSNRTFQPLAPCILSLLSLPFRYLRFHLHIFTSLFSFLSDFSLYPCHSLLLCLSGLCIHVSSSGSYLVPQVPALHPDPLNPSSLTPQP